MLGRSAVADEVRVSRLRFRPAGRTQINKGLLGWTSFVVCGGFLVDGVAVRRTLAGELVLSWPARDDATGRRHRHVRPARDGIEAELLRLLRPHLSAGGVL
jgi:hypothetical protein